MISPDQFEVPFQLINPETKEIIFGERMENLLGTQRELTPVSSTNVKGVGQFNNELVVQFIPTGNTPQRTYRYQFSDSTGASQAFEAMTTTGSPGKWVWQNLRGHMKGEAIPSTKIGPAKLTGNPTIGGTTASLVDYEISNRTPVKRVGKFDELQKKLQRVAISPILDPSVGLRVEGLLGARKGFREKGLKRIDFTEKYIGNIGDYLVTDSKTLSDWIAHCIRKHVKGSELPKMHRDQCIAAGHQKFGLSKDILGSIYDSIVMDLEDGNWVTIRGTHVFIPKGKTIGSIIKEKFGEKEKKKEPIDKKKNKEKLKSVEVEIKKVKKRIKFAEKTIKKYKKRSDPLAKKQVKDAKKLRNMSINRLHKITKQRLKYGIRSIGKDFLEGDLLVEDSFDPSMFDFIIDALIDISEESDEWSTAVLEDSNNIKSFKDLRDLFVDVIRDISYEESDEWRSAIMKESDNMNTPEEILTFIRETMMDVANDESEDWRNEFNKDIDKITESIGKGKGWWGESERHSQAAKKAKKDMIMDEDIRQELLDLSKEEDKIIKSNKSPLEKKKLLEVLWGKRPILLDKLYKKGSKKGKGWHGESERHSIAAKKAKKDLLSNYTLTYVGNLYGLTRDYIPLSSFEKLTEDTLSEDFTVLEGPIARDGPYVYYKNGSQITLIKKWSNLKDIYSRYDYLPLKVSEIGTHHADLFGFAYDFKPNEETHEIESKLVIIEDKDFSDLLDPNKNYHVSPGYHDIIEKGNIQIITDLDHVALALGKEKARACTGVNEKGKSCTKVQITNYNQNFTEVVV